MLTKVRVAGHTATTALEETDIQHGGNCQNFLEPCVPGYNTSYALQMHLPSAARRWVPAWWRAQG